MDVPDSIIAITIASGAVAVFCLFMCVAMGVRMRSLARRTSALQSTLEAELSELNENIETASKQITDQARRIAWLESRVRSGRTAVREKEEVISDLTPPTKPSVTEFRHRVLSLARRGLDVNTIASMLGEPHGEIELIIGLSKAA